MNELENIKQIIREAVEKATGWITIFGPANGPEPSNQYCLLTLKDIETMQRDVIHFTDQKEPPYLIEHQRQESRLRFEIQARGNGAMDVLHKVIAYLDSTQREIDLWGAVGSGGHDSVQAISTYVNGKILPVAILTIDINATLPVENVVEYMNRLDISTKTGNITITTTVPKEEES